VGRKGSDNREGWGKWRFYFLGRIINSLFHVRKVGGDARSKKRHTYWPFQSWNVAINCRLYFVNFHSLKLFSLFLTLLYHPAPYITFATVTKLLKNLSILQKTSYQTDNKLNEFQQQITHALFCIYICFHIIIYNPISTMWHTHNILCIASIQIHRRIYNISTPIGNFFCYLYSRETIFFYYWKL